MTTPTIYDSAARLARALQRIDDREAAAIAKAHERATSDRKALLESAEPEVVAVYAAAQRARQAPEPSAPAEAILDTTEPERQALRPRPR